MQDSFPNAENVFQIATLYQPASEFHDRLALHHTRIEAWILDQAGVSVAVEQLGEHVGPLAEHGQIIPDALDELPFPGADSPPALALSAPAATMLQ